MIAKFFRWSAAALVTTFAACGGGGGGGGDGGGPGRSARTGVRILHGAIDEGPVDVTAGAETVGSAKFGDVTLYGQLSTGAQVLSLGTRTGIPLFSESAQVESNQHYSYVLSGNQDTLGLRANLIVDASSGGEVPEGKALVRIVHAAAGASQLAGSAGGTSLGRAAFGAASAYVEVPAGAAPVELRRAADQTLVAALSAVFESGGAYTIFAAGEIDYFTVARVLRDH